MFNLEYQEILNSLQIWGYPLMFLLMTIEGPIATLGGAFLASLGFFNVFIVLILSIIGDLIADIVFYFLGFWGGKKYFIKNKSKKNLAEIVKDSFKKNGARLVFFTKITIGLSFVTFTLAGASKLSFKKFLFYSFLGGVVWSSGIVFLGYYFGKIAEMIEKYIKIGGYFIFLVALLIVIFLINYPKNKFLKKFKQIKNTYAKKN